MNKVFTNAFAGLCLFTLYSSTTNAQITLLQDYKNNVSAPIGGFQNINFREAGFSALTVIPNTNGKEFWTISDRGVNVDYASANASATPVGTVTCTPTYDKMFAFPNYAPKIHRIRINGDSVQILQTITMKRPNGSTATGLMNPAGLGSTTLEAVSTNTVSNCANFAANTAAKDIWGIDSEGIAVDQAGNFWISEEGGPTIWKLSPAGIVLKRYTPYGNLANKEAEDIAIDTVFKYRKNNRGFECLSITPNGKIYALIQSPLLFPNLTTGEATQVHRMIEIDPATNATRVFVYLNEGIIGASGANQIRLRDWKLGDMAAINNNEFLVIEAAARGTTDKKAIYKINISNATPVTSALYNGQTAEALSTATAMAANNIVPVTKTLFMDLLANNWPSVLDKSEGLTIINDSTIALCNDNDFAQTCPLANGIAITTTNTSHVIVYGLKGTNKVANFQAPVVLNPTSFETAAQTNLSSVRMYPNPAAGLLVISTPAEMSGTLNIRILDVNGKTALSVQKDFSLQNNELSLNTELLTNGIYFVELGQGVVKTMNKLIIMH